MLDASLGRSSQTLAVQKFCLPPPHRPPGSSRLKKQFLEKVLTQFTESAILMDV
ncbi:hypothetical protein QUA41_20530 [Microcoleus sp. Pol11C1]|uniref:hypothetical protein n=1 Tax=unclassified Microcoleus TaxID=2642155 RepID=UPI002FD1A0D7